MGIDGIENLISDPNHHCSTPSTGTPGQTWTCPVCQREWRAVDESVGGAGLYIWWKTVL